MSRKTHCTGGTLAVIAVMLLGLGIATKPSIAGERTRHHHHHDHHHSREADQARLLGQIVVSLLGASQPEVVHYYRPAPQFHHKRHAWHHRYGDFDRSCTTVTRTVIDRFGRRSQVVTRRCVDDDDWHPRHRNWR